MKLMAKLFPEKIQLDGTSRLLKRRKINQISKVSSSKNKDIGSSMVELLLATTLALVAVNASAQLINHLSTSGLNRRAAATNEIEVAISNDLAWFRQYAVLWQLEKGPYGNGMLPKEVTQTNYMQDPTIKYKDLPAGWCGTSALANAFQKDAAKLKTDFDAIRKPPYNIPNGTSPTTIDLPKSASGYELERIIQSDSTEPGTLTITYTLTNPAFVVPLIFERSSSIYLPAAGWC